MQIVNRAHCGLKNLFVLLTWLIACSHFAFSNVKITGEIVGKEGVNQIEVTAPVGSYYNYSHKVYYPVINNKFTLDLSVSALSSLQIRTGFNRIFLFVAPGDDIKIKIYDTADKYRALQFEGNNAAGQYAYNVYNNQPLATRISQAELFAALDAKSKNESLKKLGRFLGRQTRMFEVLYKQQKVSAEFLSLVKTDIRSEQVVYITGRLTELQNQIVNKSKIGQYEEIKNALMAFAGPGKVENTRSGFGAGYLTGYYFNLAEHKKMPNDKTWGYYSAYKLAPKAIQEFLIGDALMFAKFIGSSEFTYEKAFPIYKKEFTSSPYNAFLDTVNTESINAGKESDIRIDTLTRFKSFDQLTRFFKGKAIYVDLWATWCMPCRAEFPYYSGIRSLLKQKDITSVFISVDAQKDKQKWKSAVMKEKLAGYNIMVDKTLMNDLVKLLYKNSVINIPRYILINKQGKVISLDAPRPSNPDLKNMLAKL